MRSNNFFCFSRFIIMPLALIFLNGCMSTVDKGYLINIEPTGKWQKTESFIAGNKNINIFSSCDYYRVEPSVFDFVYTSWIGPPLLPIIPLSHPKKQITEFRVSYYEKKRNINCPSIRINKESFIKETSRNDGTCFYYVVIPSVDFTMSFDVGVGNCQLDDLKFKVKPFNAINWFWMFNG